MVSRTIGRGPQFFLSAFDGLVGNEERRGQVGFCVAL